MMRKPSDSVIGTMAVCLPVLLLIGLFLPGAAVAGHKLADSQCVDCHVTGGSLSNVVDQSRLIRIDSRISEIVANKAVPGWDYGKPLPCIYCHDKADKSVRENMIGVWNDFTNSISSHPVDAYNSFSDGDGDATTLDCIDCHDVVNAVPYVAGGSAPGTNLSPNIHNKNVAAVAWTPESAGLLTAADTFKAWVASATSPYNAGSNTFCTEQCHDANPGTGYNAQQAAHGYTSSIVSLENGTYFFTASAIQGCLNEPATGSGCHAVHKSGSTDLITTLEWGTSTLVGREDCGSCHVFDDASTSSPLPRADSDFNTDGHGQFAVACLKCHNENIPHFTADGLPAEGSSEGRLNFVLDNIPSGFSTPAKSRLSICVSSSCHSGYLEHAPSTSGSYPVGCLDCHDPHGYGVGSNVRMMRQYAPIASPASTPLAYANSGDWYNSAQSSGFTFYGCDSSDCHPLSINAIMDTTTGTHGGGTGFKSGCENCHKHQGGEYSWAATGCDQCHGAAGSYWPSDTSSPDDGGASPDNAGRHPIHRQEIAAALGYDPATTSDGLQKTMCRYCHKVGDSDHTSSTRAEVFTVGYAKAIWDTATEAPSETNASFVAGTNLGTCNDVDCHNNKQTAAGYRWYESTVAACTMCHTVGTGNASAFVDPESGLHDESPRVSGVTHDDSFSYSGSTGGCVTCHTATPSSAHYDGNDDSTIGTTGNTAIAFTAGVGFADSTIPPSCAVSIAGCHLEADVGETWKRLWTENADQTDGTECAGCHGDFTAGWAGGVMHATAPSTKGNGTHANTGLLTYECTDCHAIGDA
ncbi:MAG: hypothetical protein P1S46_11810, partial [bacterium]|nr:hypothetical protein [bacterium]